jgi:hypothetical protein
MDDGIWDAYLKLLVDYTHTRDGQTSRLCRNLYRVGPSFQEVIAG